MERIYRYIRDNQLLQEHDTILLALSGGADSMLALHALLGLKEQYQLAINAVHINHGLRGTAADLDENFVTTACAELGVKCYVKRVDVRQYASVHHLSEEAAGHELRYQIFAELMSELGADKLALGHHLNDRSESVLMHMISGCAPAGLAVLEAKQDKIIRPLLFLTKDEILAICARENISYCTDATNYEMSCLRNRVRLELLPLLRQQYNARIDHALVQLAQLSGEDESYFKMQVAQCWQECARQDDEQLEIDVSVWRGYHIALKRRILEKAWQEISGKQKLSFKQIEQIIDLAHSEKGEKKLFLPHGFVCLKSYDRLILSKNIEIASESYALNWANAEDILVLPCGVLKRQNIAEMVAISPNQAMVDGDKLAPSLLVRNRRPGDRMRPLGAGEKKIKDILIDKKIPQSLREELPLVISGSKIVWLANVAVSEEFKVTEETKNIVLFSYEANE